MKAVEWAIKSGRAVYWVAPRVKQLREAWRVCRRLTRPIPGTVVKTAEQEIELVNGGRIAFRTGDDPEALKSEGLGGAVMDECGTLKRDVWYEALYPALLDVRAPALFIGTPKGRGQWFYEVYARGLRGDAGWSSFSFPTWANPIIDRGDLEAERAAGVIPDSVWRQEIMAEFVDHEGEVFRFVSDAATLEPTVPDGRRAWLFADLASTGDFNAVAVVTRSGNHLDLAHVDRWNRIPMVDTINRILAAGRRYGASMAVDATGLGGDFAHQWIGRNEVDVVGVKFNNELKQKMVTYLQAMLEHRQIRLLRPDVSPSARALYDELLDYECRPLPSGAYRYSAPDGRHDDMVTALMGAAWMAHEGGGAGARSALHAVGVV